MSDDFEGFERAVRHGGYWSALGYGGPLDGAAINVETPGVLPMRGMALYVLVGDTVEAAAWHVYAYGNRFDPQSGAVGGFTHLGTIKGDPPQPEPGAPGEEPPQRAP